MKRVLELRERARKVRWMAAQLTDDRDRERLFKFAEDIEEKADALERKSLPPPSNDPPSRA